jgi:hypothetical protein
MSTANRSEYGAGMARLALGDLAAIGLWLDEIDRTEQGEPIHYELAQVRRNLDYARETLERAAREMQGGCTPAGTIPVGFGRRFPEPEIVLPICRAVARQVVLAADAEGGAA